MVFSRDVLIQELAWRKKWNFPENLDINDVFDVGGWLVKQVNTLTVDLPVSLVLFLGGVDERDE